MIHIYMLNFVKESGISWIKGRRYSHEVEKSRGQNPIWKNASEPKRKPAKS